MAALTVRGLDDRVKEALRRRAAEHGHSMEAEIRDILAAAVADRRETSPQQNAFADLMAYFTSIGGVELELPERELAREVNLA